MSTTLPDTTFPDTTLPASPARPDDPEITAALDALRAAGIGFEILGEPAPLDLAA